MSHKESSSFCDMFPAGSQMSHTIRQQFGVKRGNFSPRLLVLFLSLMATVERKGHLRASQ